MGSEVLPSHNFNIAISEIWFLLWFMSGFPTPPQLAPVVEHPIKIITSGWFLRSYSIDMLAPSFLDYAFKMQYFFQLVIFRVEHRARGRNGGRHWLACHKNILMRYLYRFNL